MACRGGLSEAQPARAPPRREPERLDAIFEAVLRSADEVERVLRDAPMTARSRMAEDHLVDAIPHWLYVGDTALHLAAAAVHVDAARLLLRAGADPCAANRRGATPLHYACDPRPNTGTRRDDAARTRDDEAQAALIALLVEHGADVDHADRGGATALHRAVRARSPAAVRQLLALGARTDVRLKKGGSTPQELAERSTGASGTAGAVDEPREIVRLLRANDRISD